MIIKVVMAIIIVRERVSRVRYVTKVVRREVTLVVMERVTALVLVAMAVIPVTETVIITVTELATVLVTELVTGPAMLVVLRATDYVITDVIPVTVVNYVTELVRIVTTVKPVIAVVILLAIQGVMTVNPVTELVRVATPVRVVTEPAKADRVALPVFRSATHITLPVLMLLKAYNLLRRTRVVPVGDLWVVHSYIHFFDLC